MNKRYTSIVFVHYSDNEERTRLMRRSFASLQESVKDLPVEIIVVNNGCYADDALFSLSARDNEIVSYIYNSSNMHFGFARNQGILMAAGNYICIVDNDLIYKKGWLEGCWEVLEAYPEKKLYATPLHYPTPVLKERYDQGELNVGNKIYQLNMRAGSNCFVARHQDFKEIGMFKHHRIAGTKWTDEAVRKGYLAAVVPDNLVTDVGLRNGYNHTQAIAIKRVLTNGEEMVFNQDEYTLPN